MKKATLKDTDFISDLLTSCFINNKSIQNVTRNGKNKTKRVKKLMTYFFLDALYNGDVFINSKENACLLMKKGNVVSNKSIYIKIKMIYWKIKLFFDILGIKNVLNVIQRGKAIEKNHPRIPFLHLFYIGVDPSAQGKGIGSDFLKEVINYYKDFKVIYLETSDVKNIPFYERLDFDVVNKHSELEITLYILKKKI